MTRRVTRLLAIALLLVFAAPLRAAEPSGVEFFERKIRPVLAEHCFGCHGKDRQKAHLRLDSRAALLKGGDNGPALLAGDPAKSLLIRAIRYTEDELRMPPKRKLPDAVVADFSAWIKGGAPWPATSVVGPSTRKEFDLNERRRHWCWQPVKAPAAPAVSRADWPCSPIDRFLLAKLEAAGLSAAPDADRRTLLRRVTFDLTGLPPTPEEIAAALADASETWFEKVVDRLLASPRYGERWGRHWLDLTRYAETCGHEFDFDMPEAYRYRDYVIRAFNADLPYDRLIREHVAGDLLPRPRRHPTDRTDESILGTGFWFLGEAKHSPVDVRVDEADRIDNQIDVFTKAFLGLTVSCARCHDHKFDAITTKDYHALMGYLQSSRYQQAFIDPPERLASALGSLKDAQTQARALAVARTAQVLQNCLENPGNPQPAPPDDPLAPWLDLAAGSPRPEPFAARRREFLRRLKARAARADAELVFADFNREETLPTWFVSGPAFASDPPVGIDAILSTKPDRPISAIVGPGMVHSGRIADRLPGVLRSPTFVLSKKKIAYRVAGRHARVRLVIDGLQLIRDPIYGGLEFAVDHGSQPRWRVQDVSMWTGHHAYIEVVDGGPGFFALDRVIFSDTPTTTIPPNPLLFRILADARLDSAEEWSRQSRELFREIIDQWRKGVLATATDRADRLELLNDLLRRESPPAPGNETDRAPLADLLRKCAEAEARLPAPRRALAMTDGTPRTPRVYIRGNPKTPGDEVPRRFLEALVGNAPSAPQGSGRLELAERLTDPANPLVARVMVNRLWQHHFGEGLVRSVDNFGVLGEMPTHPELLDWLATEFIRQGWSIKKMHRLMLRSRAYRMSSRADDRVAEERDPQNKLLHRMPIQRLEAEAIRDTILSISGRLDPTMYGPSVMPHLTPHMAGRGRPGHSGPLDGAGRRSIYLGVRRNFLTPMFLAFDYPIPFTTMGRRSVSNVPAQALTLLNNPFVIQQAELWAKRVLAQPDRTARQRIGDAYETAFGRLPAESELAEALKFLEERGKPDDPRVWADLCHVLMNVKEFIFVN